ncbi:MAG: hypothetical protein HYV02_02485 [Deltaproteobacteria bacterium]|nr:hypothetical protein [Deltaproteobacteria bacterium]
MGVGHITLPGGGLIKVSDKNGNAVWESGEIDGLQDDLNFQILHEPTLLALLNSAGFAEGSSWGLETLLENAGKFTAIPDDAAKQAEYFKKSQEQLGTLQGAAQELAAKKKDAEQALKTLKQNPPMLNNKKVSAEEAKKLIDKKTQFLANVEKALQQAKVAFEQAVKQAQQQAAQAEQAHVHLKSTQIKANIQQQDQKDARTAFDAFKKQLKFSEQTLKNSTFGSNSGNGLGQKKAALTSTDPSGDGSSIFGTQDGDGTGTGSASGTYGASKGAGSYGAFGEPAGGGTGITTPYDMNSLLAGNLMQENVLNGLDETFQSQNESKKMMLLFFMLSRMAMSGDIGAMYQFLRFISHIINKDKAMQNVQLARKLIELQDVSRKLTQILVDTPAHDPDDPGVQAEYMKLQQKTQAEQGVIATSQKLIAQMLEEFTQVSEMMTGMTKSLLDARGRELQMLAVWRS